MENNITKKNIISIIDNAQSDYDKCWEVLRILKESPSDIHKYRDVLQSFQYILTQQLYLIETKNEQISKLMKKTVNQNDIIKLKEYRSKLKIVSEIGRSLGDAYMWIFYMNDRDLIRSHLSHTRNPPYRKTHGYKSEISFIKNFPFIGNYLVIYHGNTTMLRLGDISIYCQSKKKIVGIAEIKSKPIKENSYTLTIHFVMKDKDNEFIQKLEDNPDQYLNKEEPVSFNIKAKERLQRQLDEISSSMGSSEKKGKNIKGIHDFSRLNCFLTSKSQVDQISDSMIGVKIRSKHKKLSSYLFNIKEIKIEEDLLTHEMQNILIERTNKNKLVMQSFHISEDFKIINSNGIPPTFWYPLDIKALKKIYFMNMRIVTLYNSYILEDMLIKKDYKKTDTDKYVKKVGQYTMEIPNLDYYHYLIRFHCIENDYIIKTFDDIFEKSKSNKNQKINIIFNLWT